MQVEMGIASNSNVVLQDPIERRISSFIGHQITFLNQLNIQYQSNVTSSSLNQRVINKIDIAYGAAIEKLRFDQRQLIDKYKDKSLTTIDNKQLSRDLKEYEKEFIRTVRNLQRKTQFILSGIDDTKKNEKKIEVLEKRGVFSKLLKFYAAVVKGSDTAEIVKAWNESQANMIEQSLSSISHNDEKIELTSDIDQQKNSELDNAREKNKRVGLKHRKNVMIIHYQKTENEQTTLHTAYRIYPLFHKKQIKEQFKSFVAQEASSKERTTIQTDMTFEYHDGDKTKEKKFHSKYIPMNAELDKKLKSGGFFAKIFGKRGLSSLDRHETHAVNAYLTTLSNDEGNSIFSAIRHAAITDMHQKNKKVRANNSAKIAQELAHLAILQQLDQQKISLNDVPTHFSAEKPLELSLVSMSLLTPDMGRQIPLFGESSNEAKMLQDQVKALKKLEKLRFIEINGIKIPVKIKVLPYNYGVNDGAVKYKQGTLKQSSINKSSLKILSHQQQSVTQFIKKLETLNNAKIYPQMKKIRRLKRDADDLFADIQLLSKNSQSYLTDNNNQFELSAKILIYSNIMNKIAHRSNQIIDNTPSENQLKKMPVTTSMINCKSGKDRTGYLNDVVFTYEVMRKMHKSYPSHAELQNDKKADFTHTLVRMLLESQSISITEINTDAWGYKVTEICRVAGLEEEEFNDAFRKIQGLSKTTSG